MILSDFWQVRLKKMQGNNHKGIYLQLHIVKDKDILQKLKDVGNKQGYIKNLILEDIRKGDKDDQGGENSQRS